MTSGARRDAGGQPRWQHKKRGTTYVEIGRGLLRDHSGGVDDGCQMVAYRSEDDGRVWFRAADEFDDGRFEALSSLPPGGVASELRLCGYCKAWHSKPCGEGCHWEPTDLPFTPPGGLEWQSMDTAPSGWGQFFLVRPKGLHPGTGKPFVPTVVQQADGEFFTAENELKPIYFGQNETPDHPLYCAGLEWQPLPNDALPPGGLEEAIRADEREKCAKIADAIYKAVLPISASGAMDAARAVIAALPRQPAVPEDVVEQLAAQLRDKFGVQCSMVELASWIPIAHAALSALPRQPEREAAIREALEEIAQHRTLKEMGTKAHGNFEAAYDLMISVARRALLPSQPEEPADGK